MLDRELNYDNGISIRVSLDYSYSWNCFLNQGFMFVSRFYILQRSVIK